MSQRIRVLRELGDELERIVREAPAVSPPRRRDRARVRLDQLATGAPRAVAPALGVLVVVAVVLGAVLFVRPAGHNAPASASGSGLRRLISQFAVLRRPQTTADRNEAGAAPSYGGAQGFSAAQGSSRGRATLEYSVRITGLAHYRNMPELTRVVNVDRGSGVAVRSAARSRPRAAEGNGQRQRSEGCRAARNTCAPGADAARGQCGARLRTARQGPRTDRVGAGQPPGGAAIVPPLTTALAESRTLFDRATASWGVNTESLAARGGQIVAVVPDGVARVSWGWPRQFDSGALSYVPPVGVSATVQDNVAVAAAPERFASPSVTAPPETVVRYAADGSVLARFTTSRANSGDEVIATNDSQSPRPETPQSRRAERNPSTPNPVVIVPGLTSLKADRNGPGPQFFFKVLLNHRGYFERLTGGPRPGCVQSYPSVRAGPGYGQTFSSFAVPTVRGDTFGQTVPIGAIACTGTYRLSVSVLDSHNHPYPPFGSATFTVR